MKEIYCLGSFDEDNNYIISGSIVSIFYFRAGYCIEDFMFEDDNGNNIGWKARESIELSNAIKVPDIDALIITLKKFQHSVNDEVKLSKLISKVENIDQSKVKEITDNLMSNFAQIIDYNELNETQQNDILEKLEKQSDNYLIKPMKEGGGNNYNYDEVRKIAERKDLDILHKSIIMERIFPPVSINYVLKGNTVVQENVITEVGIYSYILSDCRGSKITEIANHTFGALFRTKFQFESEGGISYGASYANYGYLVENYLS